MVSGPITSWKIEGKNVEAITDFIFLGSKITTDADCSYEIKRHLLLESYDKPRHYIKKQRHHFSDKRVYCQCCFFPAAMYECEVCTIKKAEC